MARVTNEIKLGPVTLVDQPSPAIPDISVQAAVVADYREQVYRLNLFGEEANPQMLESFARLAQGDLSLAYSQRTEEEIEQEQKLLTVEFNGQTYRYYDDHTMQKALLPVEEQLLLDYHKARAQLWAVEHGAEISWSTWDRIRSLCKVKQASLSASLKQTPGELSSANTRAHRLVYSALEIPEHSGTERSALASVIFRDLFVNGYVVHPLHRLLPIQIPQRIPHWVWKEGLWATVPGSWLLDQTELLPPLPVGTYAMPSAKPMMMADRALRTPFIWLHDGDFPMYMEKKNPGIKLHYVQEGAAPDEIRKALLTLDPRSSDVWHLLLAKALENGQNQVYQPVEVDARQLARALGYKPHHKGGMKPRDIDEVVRALEHISNLWITVTPDEGTTVEVGQAGKKRRAKQVTETTQQRLLAIMGKREQRDLFGATRFLIWEVALGKWAHLFPTSYAPVFKGLVDLPARGKDLWAKQLGKELSFWYREDRQPDSEDPSQRRREKRIRVQSLLERACLMPEVEGMRSQGNRKRPREYFEAAMDILHELKVHDGWQYDETQARALEAQVGKPGAMDAWLQTNVVVTAPLALLEALPALQSRKRKG